MARGASMLPSLSTVFLLYSVCNETYTSRVAGCSVVDLAKINNCEH